MTKFQRNDNTYANDKIRLRQLGAVTSVTTLVR